MTDRLPPRGGMFRSLARPNYRLWAAGTLVSNIGTWMQRTSQDWLVLTQLTQNSASAVGIVVALQFGPTLLLLPFTGFAADYFDRRKLMMLTQAAMAMLALALGVLTVTAAVQLWHVYVFAFVFGCVSAFDAPARQTFVTELVGDKNLANAVALNSTSFNAARMIGPAVAGLCIAAWGTGWAFLINGFSFLAVLASLLLLNRNELRHSERATIFRGNFRASLGYVRARGDLKTMFVMIFLVGTFAFNFSIFILTMAVKVFGVDADRYGLLMSLMAAGTIIAALLSAGRERPTIKTLTIGALALACALGIAASSISYWMFAASLVLVGLAWMTFNNTGNSLVQLSSEPAMRGRIVALRLAIMTAGIPIGAPLVGIAADRFGPRLGLVIGALACLISGLVGWRYLRARKEARRPPSET